MQLGLALQPLEPRDGRDIDLDPGGVLRVLLVLDPESGRALGVRAQVAIAHERGDRGVLGLPAEVAGATGRLEVPDLAMALRRDRGGQHD